MHICWCRHYPNNVNWLSLKKHAYFLQLTCTYCASVNEPLVGEESQWCRKYRNRCKKGNKADISYTKPIEYKERATLNVY